MFENLLPLLIPVLYGLYRKGFSKKSYNDELKKDLEKKENRKLDELEKRETITSEGDEQMEETPGILENLFKEQRGE